MAHQAGADIFGVCARDEATKSISTPHCSAASPSQGCPPKGGTPRKIGWGCAARFSEPLPYL